MSVSLVDSHCHLPLLEDDLGIASVLDFASDLGVTDFLCVSVDLETFPEVLRLARQYPQVSASVGLHPNAECVNEPEVSELSTLAVSDNQIVAVGETGLDYYRSQGELEWQRQRFRTHIQAAKEVGKPLIIHSREAKQDVVRILKEEGANAVGGVMHCFVDDWETAQQAMDMGFYISFSGIVTFKNARQVQEVAKQVPLDRLLIETDSPYLAPVPYRGKQNQPGYVRYVAEFLAELKQEPLPIIARSTTENYLRLFNIIK